MLLSMSALLLAGCATPVSSPLEKADRLTVPDVKEYTPTQQKKAADEMDKHCGAVPILCEFVNDYGRMRDQARAALGLPVNTKR
jgi:hypothetical protein